MKKLSTLLLALALVGFSACGSKKNKTDENAVANQFCNNGVCYNNGSGYNGQNGSVANAAQLAQKIGQGEFKTQTNPTETHKFVTGTVDYDTSSWWIFDWNTSNFNQSSTYNVVSSNSGAVSGNPYGSGFSEILNNLVVAVSSGQIMQVAPNVYKALTSAGDVIYIDFNQTIGANPTQIEYANGDITYRQSSHVGF